MKINFKATMSIVALSTAFALIGCRHDDIKSEFSENPNQNSIENAFAAKTVVPLANCVAQDGLLKMVELLEAELLPKLP